MLFCRNAWFVILVRALCVIIPTLLLIWIVNMEALPNNEIPKISRNSGKFYILLLSWQKVFKTRLKHSLEQFSFKQIASYMMQETIGRYFSLG
jgi:hypothetical protein